jgi:hypothetical protein
MKQVYSFLMVGMAFTALQVATAEANDMECVNAGTPSQVADCWKAKAQSGSMKHGQNQHDGTQGSTTQGFSGEQHHDGSKGQQHHDGAQGGQQYDGAQGGQHHDGAQGQQHHDDMKAQQHYDDMGNKGQQHHEGTQGNAAQGFSGEHQDKGGHHDGPQGGHHDGPPIDPRSGQPFTQADEAKFQRFADECEATRGLLSEGSTQELVKEGFTRIQVEKLCKDGPEQGSGGGQGGHNAPPARR